MKKADEYLGSILCRLLGKSPAGTGVIPADPENILFIKFWGMGSIILTVPAVNAVRKKFPKAKLHYLTFESNRETLQVLGIADDIITINLTNPVKFNFDTLKLIRKLRKMKFDIVYDFEFFTYYSALINRLIKSAYSVGFDNRINRRGRLFAGTAEFNDHTHTRDNFLNLVNAITLVNPEIQTGFVFNKSIMAKESSPYIVVNPNASKMAYERRLPAEHFVKIIKALTANGKYKIILTGSTEEVNYVSAIYSKLKDNESITNLSGRLNVKELFELIQSSACLITNDSGPLHIASALDKPVIAFFGPESPVRYGPLSTKQLVFYRGLECSPCMSVSNSKTVNCIYNEPKCMTGFDAEEITQRISEFLNNL